MRTSIPNAPEPNIRGPCWKISAGSVFAGRKARTSAALARHISRACGGNSTLTPGAGCATPGRSIRAVARERILLFPLPPLMMVMTSLCTPAVAATKIQEAPNYDAPAGVNWRFLVRDGESIQFVDRHRGAQSYVAGEDFGDFVVWRRDDVPAYQLAVVVDDAAMQVTEVVRGADLLKSTACQLLLSRALGLSTPAYFHCDLVRDDAGSRLAKRHDALSLRALREQGLAPEQVLTKCPHL